MRNYKILAVLLTFISLVLSFPSVAAEAATEGNLLANSNFASGTAGWSWPSGSSLSTDVYYGTDNTKAAKITKTVSGGEISVIQTLGSEAIVPGAVYRASAKLRGELKDNYGFRLVMKFYSWEKGEFDAASSERYISTTQGKWVDIAFDFVMPEECDRSFQLWLRLDGMGTVYVDDVMLEIIGNPDPFQITTSHVFHYTGDKTGTAEVTLHDFYGDDSEEAHYDVIFSILDGLKYKVNETISITNRKASFTYDVDEILKEKQKKYFFNIKVYKPGNTVTPVKSYSQGLYLYDRPSRLSEEGEYIIDGKVFNPVIGCHVKVEDYARVKEAGINVVQVNLADSYYLGYPENVERAYKALEDNDLYGIFSLYTNMKPAGTDTNLANTLEMVKRYATKERVFAWMVMDEPMSVSTSAEYLGYLEKSYHEIRRNDSMHPVLITDFNQKYFDLDLKYCDVFAPDNYSSSQTAVKLSTEAACAAAKKAGNKPVYTLVSTFMSATQGMPTGDIVRSTVYQAVLGGADGVGFYSFSDSIPKELSGTGEPIPLYDVESLWPTMQKLREEIPILFSTAVRQSYKETKTENYLLRQYGMGGRMIVLPLCSESYSLSLEAGKTVTIFCGDESLLSEKPNGEKILTLGKFTPMLWQYDLPQGNEILILQNGVAATQVSGTLEIVYMPGTATLYAALYEKNSREMKEVFVASHSAKVLVVKVPEGEYTLSAFAFKPKTLMPLVEKKSL